KWSQAWRHDTGELSFGFGAVQFADEAGDFFDVVMLAPGFESLGDALDSAGVGVAGGSDLDGSGSGEKEFDGIFGSGDASQAHDGDTDGVGRFPYHSDGDGFDGWAGKSGGDVGDAGAAGFDVDGKGDKSVDEREGVGSCGLSTFGHGRDGSHVRRELHNHGPGGGLLRARDQLIERDGVGDEGHASMVGVGAGGVQFIGGDALGLVAPLNDFHVILDVVAEDIDDN